MNTLHFSAVTVEQAEGFKFHFPVMSQGKQSGSMSLAKNIR